MTGNPPLVKEKKGSCKAVQVQLQSVRVPSPYLASPTDPTWVQHFNICNSRGAKVKLSPLYADDTIIYPSISCLENEFS